MDVIRPRPRSDGATANAPVEPRTRSEGTQTRALLAMGTTLANLVVMSLRHARYETTTVDGATSILEALAVWSPDIALIDVDEQLGLLDLTARSAPDVPRIALTRTRRTAVKLAAYEHGADDVIEVPFTLDEIVARPYALLRRRGIVTPLAPRIQIGRHLEADLIAQTLTLEGGRVLELTPIQQALLYLLAANEGQTLTREELLATIWGGDLQIESNVVDRHIRELRVKLGDDWRAPRYLETVPGRGYRLRRKDDEEERGARRDGRDTVT